MTCGAPRGRRGTTTTSSSRDRTAPGGNRRPSHWRSDALGRPQTSREFGSTTSGTRTRPCCSQHRSTRRVVSERLGDRSVAFTLDTYAHVMPGLQPEAAERFMDLVFGATADDEEDGPDETEPSA